MKLLLALVLVGASTASALADPVSLTATVASLLSAAGATGFAATAGFAQLITGALLIGGSIGINLLLGPKPPSVDPGAARETFESVSSPELRAVGRVRLGGLKVYGNTTGQDRYRLIAHCKGEIDGYESYYLNGFEVTLQNDDSVNSYPWRDEALRLAYIESKVGTNTETAWADLVAEFPEWTSSHRVRGIAQSLCKFVSPGMSEPKFLEVYQSGVPDLEVLVRAEAVYDPRSELTEWSENGVLNALHILLSYPEFGLSDIDTAFIESEADRADALIATRDGDVPRARCSGVWSSETPRGENLKRVLDSIGAWIIPRENGSSIGIQLIDDDQAAEATFPVRHILSVDWRSGPEGVERPNVCRLKYYCPERHYELSEIDISSLAWAVIQDEIDAYGEKPFDIELPFCPNAGQAQRIARRMFSMGRSDSGVIRTNMAGLSLWGCRVVNFEFPDDIGTIKCLIGAPKVIDDEGAVEIPFVVWPTLSTWNTSTDEVDAPEQLPDVTLGTALTTPDAPIEATVVEYPSGGTPGGGGFETRVRYTVPGDAVQVEAVYREYTNGNPDLWELMTEVDTGVKHAYRSLDLRSEPLLDFRFRTFNEAAHQSSGWSPLFSTSTLSINNNAPAIPTFNAGAAGLSDDTITAPNSFRVAYLRFTEPTGGGGTIVTLVPVRPGQVLTRITDFPLAANEVTARSSNGTASASLSF